jgi:hypothetical protein
MEYPNHIPIIYIYILVPILCYGIPSPIKRLHVQQPKSTAAHTCMRPVQREPSGADFLQGSQFERKSGRLLLTIRASETLWYCNIAMEN